MSSSGTFTSTTASYRTAFLNSPGSAGSNYSYTTPVIPAGVYSVRVRPSTSTTRSATGAGRRDQRASRRRHGDAAVEPAAGAELHLHAATRTSARSTVAARRTRTPSSLIYTWNFGTRRARRSTAAARCPLRTFTAPSPVGTPFQVTLTVRDEWQVSATSAAQTVTIVEPTGNQRPGADVHVELPGPHLLR